MVDDSLLALDAYAEALLVVMELMLVLLSLKELAELNLLLEQEELQQHLVEMAQMVLLFRVVMVAPVLIL